MKGIFSVDRITEGIAVLVPDEGKDPLKISVSDFECSVNDILVVEYDGERVISVTQSTDERQRRLKRNKDKLAALLAKKKNK